MGFVGTNITVSNCLREPLDRPAPVVAAKEYSCECHHLFIKEINRF